MMLREHLVSMMSHLEKYMSTLLGSSAFAPQSARSYKPQPASPPSPTPDMWARDVPADSTANKFLVQHRNLLSAEAQTGWY
jgi:hypothetical protein